MTPPGNVRKFSGCQKVRQAVQHRYTYRMEKTRGVFTFLFFCLLSSCAEFCCPPPRPEWPDSPSLLGAAIR